MPPIDSSGFVPEEANPYAPPRVALEPELAAGDESPVSFAIGAVLGRSWAIYRARMGLCIGVAMLHGALVVGTLFAGIAAVLAAEDAGKGASTLVTIAADVTGIIFVLWITLGLMRVMLATARGAEASIGGLFSAAPFLGRATVAAFLTWLAGIGMGILLALLGGLVTAIVILAVGARPAAAFSAVPITAGLAYLGSFLALLRISPFLYLILDRQAGPVESLRRSFQITRGHHLTILAPCLISGLIALGGMTACGIGLVFTWPYIMLLSAVTYLALTGQTTTSRRLDDPR